MKKAKKRRAYGARRDYTYEDYLQIKKENKEKLDEILANPNYMEELGRKYYPYNWEVILEEGHYLKTQRALDATLRAQARAKGEDIPYQKKLTDYKIIQMDARTGEEIQTFANPKTACEELGWDEKRAHSIIRCCRGEYERTYGYKWKFDETN